MKDLTQGKISKVLLEFAIPVCLCNLLQLVYSIVDTVIVSKVLGPDSLAAVSATASVNTLIIGFLNGLTNGFGVIVARHFGAKDEKRLRKTVAFSLVLGIGISLVLTVFVLLFLTPLLNVLNTPQELIKQAYDYIFIIFAGMTILMLYNVCSAVLRAIGDTTMPLIFLALSVTLNIAGDYIFTAVFKWGVKGAAFATVLAQFIAMFLCMRYMFKKYKILNFTARDLKLDGTLIKEMLGCGTSMGFMSSLVSFGTVALQTAINTFGNSVIIAHMSARKVTEIYMLPFGVFGTTMATFCGQNLGAGKIGRIKSGVHKAIFIGSAWSLLAIFLSYTVISHVIVFITNTNDPEVVNTATLYLRIDTLLYFVTAIITTLRNAMQGIGDHITPVISSMVELIGKVLVVIFLVPKLGYMGIILAEPIVWVLMVIPLIVQWLRNPVLKNVPACE